MKNARLFSLAFLSHIPYLYAKFFHYIFCFLFLAMKMQTYVNVYSLLLCGSYRIGFMPDFQVYNKNKTKQNPNAVYMGSNGIQYCYTVETLFTPREKEYD